MGYFTYIFDKNDLAILDCMLKQHHCVWLCYLHMIYSLMYNERFRMGVVSIRMKIASDLNLHRFLQCLLGLGPRIKLILWRLKGIEPCVILIYSI